MIFISEISQPAPELFCLIAGAQRGTGLGERQKRPVRCRIYEYESLTRIVDPPALLACTLTAISKSFHLQVLLPARLCKRWFNPGLSLSFWDLLSHQRASREVKELPGDFFVLEGDAWIKRSLPSCENKGEVSPNQPVHVRTHVLGDARFRLLFCLACTKPLVLVVLSLRWVSLKGG